MASKKGLSASEKGARRASKVARTKQNKLSRVVHNTQFSRYKLNKYGSKVERNIAGMRVNIREAIETNTDVQRTPDGKLV